MAGLCMGSEWYTSSQGQARLFYRRKAETWEEGTGTGGGCGVGRGEGGGQGGVLEIGGKLAERMRNSTGRGRKEGWVRRAGKEALCGGIPFFASSEIFSEDAFPKLLKAQVCV